MHFLFRISIDGWQQADNHNMGNCAMPNQRVDNRPGNVSPVMTFRNSGKIEKRVLQESHNDDKIVVFPLSG